MDDIVLHDIDNNTLKFNINDYFNMGGFGNIYKLDSNKCFKYFYIPFKYDIEAFKKIMSLELDNFYKIYTLLYDQKNDFKGYIMKYYEHMDIDIMTIPIDYVLDNFNILYKSFNKISDNYIYVCDVDERNVVIDGNKIIMIDIDLYYLSSKLYKDDIIKHNNVALYTLFSRLLYTSLGKNHLSLNNDKMIIDNLFSLDNGVNSISKKLKKYKYPIDYVIAKRKEF